MTIAHSTSQLSTATKLKVGCIIVKDDRIISIGYNGTPSGDDNNCEEYNDEGVLMTKETVIHAEANAIAKLAKSSESANGSIMFCTHSPCLSCAKTILVSGISEVYYSTDYRCSNGLKFLLDHNIRVQKIGWEEKLNWRDKCE